MTGFGATTFEDDSIKITVEIKSLNSKFMDLSLRLPRAYSSKEMLVRNQLSKELVRGKVGLNIDVQHLGEKTTSAQLNSGVVKAYYNELKTLAEEVGAPTEDLFRLATSMPSAIENKTETLSEEEWDKITSVLKDTVVKFNEFRFQEGEVLRTTLLGYIKIIRDLLTEITLQDPKRIEGIKERVNTKITEIKNDEKFDSTRFEQEMIFYIEKLDITEEKVRLSHHLDYFEEIINSDESNGKKLGFISQEIGREINTIGSKANDSVIQKSVVGMKDELEKIKEQALNIL